MKDLTKSNEDYLEAIYVSELLGGKIKSVDIARMMHVSKPGVNKAMNILIENHLIEKIDYGDIHLTAAGRAIAMLVYKKHTTIKDFLLQLGVTEAAAEQDCCLIEHVISDETFHKIEEFLEKGKKG